MTKGERAGAILREHRGWTLLLVGATLALVAAVIFAAWPANGAPADSGVQGQVWLGPLSPVQQVGGPPNERSYSATLDVVGSDTSVVTTVRSGQDGHFRVDLAPGAYVLQGVSPSSTGLPHAVPVPVVVVAHEFTTVQVRFDTGIR
jgi:hypothetical protein